VTAPAKPERLFALHDMRGSTIRHFVKDEQGVDRVCGAPLFEFFEAQQPALSGRVSLGHWAICPHMLWAPKGSSPKLRKLMRPVLEDEAQTTLERGR
jgi:hypothetical protein